jgi:DNA replication protein DnaC
MLNAKQLRESGIPRNFIPGKAEEDLTFKHRESQEIYNSVLEEFNGRINNTLNLFLFGTALTGKTEISAILTKKALSLGKTAAMIPQRDFMQQGIIPIPDQYKSLYHYLGTVDLLVIEHIEELRFPPDTFNVVINSRWDNGLPIIFTFTTTDRRKLQVNKSYSESLDEALIRSEKSLGAAWPVRIAERFEKIFTGAEPYREHKATIAKSTVDQKESDTDEG